MSPKSMLLIDLLTESPSTIRLDFILRFLRLSVTRVVVFFMAYEIKEAELGERL